MEHVATLLNCLSGIIYFAWTKVTLELADQCQDPRAPRRFVVCRKHIRSTTECVQTGLHQQILPADLKQVTMKLETLSSAHTPLQCTSHNIFCPHLDARITVVISPVVFVSRGQQRHQRDHISLLNLNFDAAATVLCQLKIGSKRQLHALSS